MKKLCLLIGCTSSLSSEIVKVYNEQNAGIEFFGTYNSNCGTLPIKKIKYDLTKKVPASIYRTISKYQNVDIWWLAASKSYGIRETFQINYFAPVEFFSELEKLDIKANFIIFSSQGDLFGSLDKNPYNSSKAALSVYFEPLAIDKCVKTRVVLVKPWLFQSKMNKNSFLSVDNKSVVKSVFSALKKRKSIVTKHKITYSLVQVVRLFSVKLIYILIRSIKKN